MFKLLGAMQQCQQATRVVYIATCQSCEAVTQRTQLLLC